MAAKPPNIVFFQCDSMDGRIMGGMGYPAAYTPNMDRLAARGVMFRNAYSNNPICCPSRASMFSGQYTHHCEGWNNYKGLEPGASTFLTHLAAHGYTTRTFGKTDYVSGRHTSRARVTAWLRSARIMLPTYAPGAPNVVEGNGEPFDASDGTIMLSIRPRDCRVVDESARWLREHARDEKPFMLYCGVNGPHPGFVSLRYWMDKIDPDKVTLPARDPGGHPVMEYMRVAKNWTHGFNDDLVRLTRWIYFAMIADVDAQLGYLLRTIDNLGLRDNTIIVFASDHGEMAMEHRQYYKFCHYEPAARVPLIFSGPGLERGHAVDEPCSLVDLYPTIIDLARLPAPPENLDGHSLAAELAGRRGDRPDWVLSEYHDSTSCTGAFMLRRGHWKYIAYPGYAPMLFNLEADPGETNNLAADRPEEARLHERLLREAVDYPAVDAKVKDYDRESFARWREENLAAGVYRAVMGRIHRGFRLPDPDDAAFWDDDKEQLVRHWLNA